jgi:hypothetical protein
VFECRRYAECGGRGLGVVSCIGRSGEVVCRLLGVWRVYFCVGECERYIWRLLSVLRGVGCVVGV